MSEEFTPGPWEWNEGGRLFHSNAAKFYSTNVLVVHDATWRPRPADNRLIAAAPDLYEALSAILAAKRDVDTYTRGGQMSAMLMDPKEIRARADAAFIAGAAALAKASPSARSSDGVVKIEGV